MGSLSPPLGLDRRTVFFHRSGVENCQRQTGHDQLDDVCIGNYPGYTAGKVWSRDGMGDAVLVSGDDLRSWHYCGGIYCRTYFERMVGIGRVGLFSHGWECARTGLSAISLNLVRSIGSRYCYAGLDAVRRRGRGEAALQTGLIKQ